MKHIVGVGDEVYSQLSPTLCPLRTINVRKLVSWHWCRDISAAVWHNRIYGEHHCLVSIHWIDNLPYRQSENFSMDYFIQTKQMSESEMSVSD